MNATRESILSTPTLWNQEPRAIEPDTQPRDQTVEQASLVVLASSSSGNCSAILHGEGRLRRVTLIDAGLSPARTRLLLSLWNLSLDHVDDVLITHLDGDHFHPAWTKALPTRTRMHVHAHHIPRASRIGVARDRLHAFSGTITLRAGVSVRPTMLAHDEWGVVAFRFELGGGVLGYATDVGRVSPDLTTALAGADVLAIESNYCPRLQLESERPAFLKSRIMGGSGHLSNQECCDAVRAIQPRRRVVLLHLSRQCNTPERAAAGHAGSRYELIVTRPDRPTQEIRLDC